MVVKSKSQTTRKRPATSTKRFLSPTARLDRKQLFLAIGAVVVLLGVVVVIFAFAASSSNAEPETWSADKASGISVVSDNTASGGKYVQFLAATPTPVPPVNNGSFPTDASTGVPSSVTLKKWTGAMRSSAIAGTTETVDGISYKVIDGYTVDIPAGQYFSLTGSGNVLIRNSQFVGHGIPSNTMSLIQEADSGATIRFDNIAINANGYARGINSDDAHIIVNNSKFINTSDAAVEKNDRNMKTDMTVTNSYVAVDCSWEDHDPGSHTDGVQWGGARNVVVRNNTILIDSCLSYMKAGKEPSDAAIAGWAELGNVGTTVVDHNYLAGGGYTMYLQIKAAYKWNSATVTNNVFDRRYGGGAGLPLGSTSGIWGALFPGGLPSNLTWSGNTWDNGSALLLKDAN